ncbi:MAG TPA: NAD-binding protein, partial [Xanthomonadales bacterium]|nr:NAD-binding protein [Xanthomonadales bacterium]
FGLALLAIALSASVIDEQLGQIALTSVLLSMVAGAFLIRFNQVIAQRLAGKQTAASGVETDTLLNGSGKHVLIGGYGRMGHTIAVLLETSGVQYLSLDTDPKRVAQGRADGHSVMYGDIADPDLLAAVQVERSALVVITVDHFPTALRAVEFLRQHCPQVPIIARARDLEASAALLEAGATHAYPEAIEASLRLGATALQMLQVPVDDVDQILQGVRDWDYQPILEDAPESRTPE